MAIFDTLISEIGSKFGLGNKAGPLVAEVLKFMTSDRGGLSGFFDRFKTAGLGDLLSSWLGNKNPEPMPAQHVETIFGKSWLGSLTTKLGLGSSVVTPALGFLVPKVIGMLTPDGKVPTSVPPAWQGFIDSTLRAPAAEPVRRAAVPPPPATGGVPKWLMWLIPLLILAGLLWWLLSGKEEKVAIQAPAPAVVQQTTPAPVVQPAMKVQPRLGVNYHGDNYVTYSGVVKDEASRTSIIETLKGVFGAGNVFGDIKIDPNAGAATWLDKLKAAIESFKIPGLAALFDGSSINVGGLIPDTDRDRVLDSLKGVFGSGFSFAAMTDDVNAKALAQLRALKAGFSTQDVIGALNATVINFTTGKAEVPSYNRSVLKEAASVMKQLPAGTVIEIGGHTDSTGDAAANMQLSQARAEAVRAVLIEEGVTPSMLTAKGYGSTKPTASNDTAEGRYQNRRIEYTVIR